MEYIRPQVTDLSNGLSELMLRRSNFFTVPEKQPEISKICLQIEPQVNYINKPLFQI